jgi:hypothetical protein
MVCGSAGDDMLAKQHRAFMGENGNLCFETAASINHQAAAPAWRYELAAVA